MFPNRTQARTTRLASLIACIALAVGCQEPTAQRALSLVEDNRFQEAIDLLQPAVEENPSDFELQTLFGVSLLRNSQASLAVWPLRRAHQDAPEGSEAGPLLVEAYLHGGASLQAIDLATQLLENDPDNARVLHFRAAAHAANLDHASALADVDRLALIDPQNPRTLETRVNLLTEMERVDEAALALQDLKALLSDQSAPREMVVRMCGAEGTFLGKHKEPEIALAHFQTCLEDFPGETDVVHPALEFYMKIDEREAGLEMLREQAASSVGRTRLRIQSLLAHNLQAIDRTDEAVAVLLAFANAYDSSAPWVELADVYASDDQMELAAEALEKAIKIDVGLAPGDPGFDYGVLDEEARFAYADIMIQVGKFDRVRKILRRLDEPVHKVLIEARLKLAEGDAQGAFDDYLEAFKLWPSNPGGRYLAGVAALKLARFEDAAVNFRNSMRADARATDAGLILARMKFLSGKPAGVIEAGALFAKSNPKNLEVRRLIMLAAASLGAEAVAETVRDEMVALGEPGKASADYAQALGILKSSEAALEYLSELDELDDPTFGPALSIWTSLMISTGNGAEALQRIEEIIKEHPDSPDHHVVRATALQAINNDLDGARMAAERAIELDPELDSAHFALGNILSSQGATEEAIAAFDTAAQYDPSNPSYGFRAAATLLEAELGEEAEIRLREHLESFPWHGESASRLARIAVDRGDSGPETLAMARLGVEYGSDSRPFALETLAKVRLDREEPAEAKVALRKALKSRPPLPGSLYLLARILAQEDRNEEALELLEQSLQSGDFPEAQEAAALQASLNADRS